MRRLCNFSFAIFIAGFLLYSCATVPLTGRKQLNLLPESEMITLGLTSYAEFLKSNPISTDRSNTSLVKDVGSDIERGVNEFFTQNKIQSQIKDYQWEFNLIKNDTIANAFALPGGKVAVYSGLLPLTQDRNGLAVVLSHEIAHAVARHGNERMSQQLLLHMGGVALNEALSTKPDQTKSIFNTIYGVGAQLGVVLHLPYNLPLP
jgi:predicted Zn-dependent protease